MHSWQYSLRCTTCSTSSLYSKVLVFYLCCAISVVHSKLCIFCLIHLFVHLFCSILPAVHTLPAGLAYHSCMRLPDTVYNLSCTLSAVHSLLYILWCTLPVVCLNSLLYNTFPSLHSLLYITFPSVHSLYITFSSVHSLLYNLCCTFFSIL
jgi:hypothetical protein